MRTTTNCSTTSARTATTTDTTTMCTNRCPWASTAIRTEDETQGCAQRYRTSAGSANQLLLRPSM